MWQARTLVYLSHSLWRRDHGNGRLSYVIKKHVYVNCSHILVVLPKGQKRIIFLMVLGARMNHDV